VICQTEVLTIPALFKTLVVFGLVLCLSRFRMQLSLSLFIGALVLGFWMGMTPFQWLEAALLSVTHLQALSLLLIVGLLMVMSRIMESAGQMHRLVATFTRLTHDPRTVGSVMSAMVGLLPMPGGALFSAPLVETSLSGQNASAEQKALVNYWFRHIWEYWWPLYPGAVLAVALLKVQTWPYIAFMSPLTLVTAIIGIVFILKPMGKFPSSGEGERSWSTLKDFLWEMMPILVVILVIGLVAAFETLLGSFGIHVKVPGAISILPGLLAAIIWVCAVNKVPPIRIRSAFLDRGVIPMLLLVLAIIIFQGTLVESKAVFKMRDELTAYQVPLLAVFTIIPFLSGLLTGIAVGFVGLSFPLVVPMFPTNSFFDYMSCAALAYTFGYMGMMLSPVHLCFLVTKDYYKANLLKCYRHVLWPALTVMATVVLIFIALGAF
jgi:integral membrane protein (TIGR00529 family)